MRYVVSLWLYCEMKMCSRCLLELTERTSRESSMANKFDSTPMTNYGFAESERHVSEASNVRASDVAGSCTKTAKIQVNLNM